MSMLYSSLNEPASIKKQKKMTKGGVIMLPSALDHDIDRYSNAINGIKNTMQIVKMQHLENQNTNQNSMADL